MAGVEPGPTFIEALDLSRQTYGKAGLTARQNVVMCYELIKNRLSVLSQLNALVSLTFGDRPPLFIDARGARTELFDSCSDEPDTIITIKPEYLVQIYYGKLEPRYGLFKDASMPKGNIATAIKFADLLTSNPPAPPKKVVPGAFPRLPEPTHDIEQVKSDIEEFGYALVKYALIHSQIQILKKAVQEQAAGECKAGVAAAEAPDQHIWTLVNKGEEFLDLLNHPLIDSLVPWYLGEHALIHSYSANIVRPGNVPTQLHTDQIAIQPPIRDLALGLNIMWYLDDITDANGGTRVFPGSHLGHVAPDDIFTVDGTVAAEGLAGTALVYDSRLWRATGPNRETSGERPVILMSFMRSFIRQRENHFLSLRKDVEEKLSGRIKRMLGFYTTGALGGVEGEVREGIFVSRKDDCVGTLRAPHDE